MNDFNEINRLRAQAEDARRQRLVPTTPKRPVTDEDRAALVAKDLQEEGAGVTCAVCGAKTTVPRPTVGLPLNRIGCCPGHAGYFVLDDTRSPGVVRFERDQ